MAKHERSLYKKIVAGNFSIPNKSKVQELIKRLLCVSTTSRITMKDCLRHRWLASVTNFDRNDRKASQYLVSRDDPSRDLNDSTLDKIELVRISSRVCEISCVKSGEESIHNDVLLGTCICTSSEGMDERKDNEDYSSRADQNQENDTKVSSSSRPSNQQEQWRWSCDLEFSRTVSR